MVLIGLLLALLDYVLFFNGLIPFWYFMVMAFGSLFILSLIMGEVTLLITLMGLILLLGFIYYFLFFWTESLYISVMFIVSSISEHGFMDFISQDINDSLFPIRLASIIITIGIFALVYTTYKKKDLLEFNFKNYFSYSLFQYAFYVISLIFLWKINDSYPLNTEIARIAALLNWSILFIIDDFMNISKYIIVYRVDQFAFDKIKVMFFNVLIFSGILYSANHIGFEKSLYYYYILLFGTMIIVFLRFNSKKYKTIQEE